MKSLFRYYTWVKSTENSAPSAKNGQKDLESGPRQDDETALDTIFESKEDDDERAAFGKWTNGTHRSSESADRN